MGEGGKCPVEPLGYVNFTKVILKLIKHLKLIRSWFLGKSTNFCSVLSREQDSTVGITIFCILCFEAVTHGPDNVSNNLLKYVDVSGIRLPFYYNL